MSFKVLRKTYKLNNRLLKTVLKNNLLCSIVLIIFFSILWAINGFEEMEYFSFLLIVFPLTILFLNLPVIFLWIDYYYHNKETSIEIDISSNFIKIKEKKCSKTYKFSEIETSTYHLGSYYENLFDSFGKELMLHSDFGYWDLKFKNGNRYYISNLVVDFLHNKAFVEKTKYQFRILPYIRTSNSTKAIKLKKEVEKNITDRFVEKFVSKSEEELRVILNNKNKYQKNAVKAAEIVLKSKGVDANS